MQKTIILIFANCLILLFCRPGYSEAINRLFPRDQPERQYSTFAAEGFSQPVTGVIYRQGDMLPGMPLGALGTGFIALGTDGTLDYVNTIFNNFMDRTDFISEKYKIGTPLFSRDQVPTFRLPFLGISVEGKTTVLSLKRINGVRGVKQMDYWGHYPIADVEYAIDGPVSVSLRAWVPFFPGDSIASNTPGSVLEVRLHNHSRDKQKATLAFTFSGPYEIGKTPGIVDVKRRLVKSAFTGVEVTGKRDGLELGYAVGVVGNETVRCGRDLGEDAAAWQGIGSTLPAPTVDDRGASVAVDFSLEPGETKKLHFILSWYMPQWKSGAAGEGPYINIYGTRFKSAVDVAEYLTREHHMLLNRILAWQQVVYAEEKLPGWLQDGLINVLAILAQQSFMMKSSDPNHWWGDKGMFCVNESLLSCSHPSCIGNDQIGEWAVSLLFPELGLRKLSAYKHYQKQDTGQTPSGLGGRVEPGPAWYDQQLAMDGQFYVHMVERCRLSSCDDMVLDEWYPSVKAALKFMFTVDKDGDGLPDVHGANHYLDGWPMEGAAPHVSTYWLATLRIAERMAQMQGDAAFAKECGSWYDKASQSIEQKLWNPEVGSYLLYHDTATGKKSDTVICDQLMGEMHARLLGFSGILPPERVKMVLATLERLNYAATPYGIRLATRPDGSEDSAAYYSPFMIPSYSTLAVATVMLESGDPHFKELGLEIVRRTWHNLVIRQNMAWDQPCMVRVDGTRAWGLEYYHNTMLWIMPMAVLGQNVSTICSPGGFIHRLIAAAR